MSRVNSFCWERKKCLPAKIELFAVYTCERNEDVQKKFDLFEKRGSRTTVNLRKTRWQSVPKSSSFGRKRLQCQHTTEWLNECVLYHIFGVSTQIHAVHSFQNYLMSSIIISIRRVLFNSICPFDFIMSLFLSLSGHLCNTHSYLY